jgi:predicted TIM-barrel fold metal-dependent hydrolase
MDRESLHGGVFDADNHLYETHEALTKFLPEPYREAVKYVEIDGRVKIVVRGQISEFIPNPTFEKVAAPGAQEDYFRRGNPEGRTHREIMGRPIACLPEFREPQARLARMDEQGLDRTLLFPTLASLVEERFSDDPDATHAIIHALNQWLYETWSFDFEGRIFATPIITLPIVEEAVRELEWVLERGARAVLVRPAPVPGLRGPRSFGRPEFDPVWELAVAERVLVTMHASDSGYSRQVGEWEGASEYRPFQPSPLRSYWNVMHQPMADAAAALACHGAFTRFPGLSVMSVENGSDWVPWLLASLSGVSKKMPQLFSEDPAAAIRRNLFISPFWEDDIAALATHLPIDHVVFGSDFPHPEGLADPLSYLDSLGQLSDEQIRAFMGGTLGRLID